MTREHGENQTGFTLIEALVATFLFVIAMVSIVGIYMTTTQVSRTTDTMRLAMQSSRYLEEFLSKEIRNGEIDYNGPRSAVCGSFPTVSPDQRLAIVNVDGDHECFYLGDASGNASSNGVYLWMVKNNFSPVNLNPNNIVLSAFNVYVAPLTNPYCNNPPTCSNVGSNDQPRVTIIGTVQAMPGQPQSISIPLQLSVSLPIYDIP